MAWLTVGSGIAFGLNFVLIDQAPVEAKLWPLVFARLSATRAGDRHRRAQQQPAAAHRHAAATGVLAAVLDVGANIAMLLALQASLLSLAGVLMSLYPAATVLLAIVGAARAGDPLAGGRHGAGAGGVAMIAAG